MDPFILTPRGLRAAEDFLLREIPELAHGGPPTDELVVGLLAALGVPASLATGDVPPPREAIGDRGA